MSPEGSVADSQQCYVAGGLRRRSAMSPEGSSQECYVAGGLRRRSAVYGTYEAIRYKVPGLMKIRYVGQTTLGSAAIFGLFLGAVEDPNPSTIGVTIGPIPKQDVFSEAQLGFELNGQSKSNLGDNDETETLSTLIQPLYHVVSIGIIMNIFSYHFLAAARATYHLHDHS
ncbi:hypothetical protein RJ640_025474 [Escallonia rubra]|uniref:Uncharacterized protein n=1 Tax=Escallonia rubra TaxID=112253 RepID=A0AA88REJ8_9ASTE|nr:hypothetical protein RJ640_025474 [Escallonia rubra]